MFTGLVNVFPLSILLLKERTTIQNNEILVIYGIFMSYMKKNENCFCILHFFDKNLIEKQALAMEI